MKGERVIKLTPIRSEKKMVEDFLIELHEILHNPKFHIDTGFGHINDRGLFGIFI